MTGRAAGRAVLLPGGWMRVWADEPAMATLLAHLDPYTVTSGEPSSLPLVNLRREGLPPTAGAELQNLAGDGWVTVSQDGYLGVVEAGRMCWLDPAAGTILAEPSFPVRRLMSILRPMIQLRLLEQAMPTLHAACVEDHGKAILVAGWSESGKTETALGLMEQGAQFVSDKWTVLPSAGHAAPFPIGVGIRRWVLPYLPRLRAGLPGSARWQFRIAGAAAGVSTPLRGVASRSGFIGAGAALARRAVQLADRAGLRPTDLRTIYGSEPGWPRSLPLSAVVILRNGATNEISVATPDPRRMTARLAISAATEREPYLALLRRMAFATATLPDTNGIITADELAIAASLDGVRLLEVTAPFPTDPRRVAAAIVKHL